MEAADVAGLLGGFGALGEGAVAVAIGGGSGSSIGGGLAKGVRSISERFDLDVITKGHTVASSFPAAWRPPRWPASFAASEPLANVPSALRSAEVEEDILGVR